VLGATERRWFCRRAARHELRSCFRTSTDRTWSNAGMRGRLHATPRHPAAALCQQRLHALLSRAHKASQECSIGKLSWTRRARERDLFQLRVVGAKRELRVILCEWCRLAACKVARRCEEAAAAAERRVERCAVANEGAKRMRSVTSRYSCTMQSAFVWLGHCLLASGCA
jgi:hypothetical protein